MDSLPLSQHSDYVPVLSCPKSEEADLVRDKLAKVFIEAKVMVTLDLHYRVVVRKSDEDKARKWIQHFSTTDSSDHLPPGMSFDEDREKP